MLMAALLCWVLIFQWNSPERRSLLSIAPRFCVHVCHTNFLCRLLCSLLETFVFVNLQGFWLSLNLVFSSWRLDFLSFVFSISPFCFWTTPEGGKKGYHLIMKIVSLKESLRNDAILNCMVTGLFSYANQQLPWVPQVFSLWGRRNWRSSPLAGEKTSGIQGNQQWSMQAKVVYPRFV